MNNITTSMRTPTKMQRMQYMIRFCMLYLWIMWNKVVMVWKCDYNHFRNGPFFKPQLLRVIHFKGKAFINDTWIIWRHYFPGHGYVVCDPYIARSNRPLHEPQRRPPTRRVRRI